MNIRNTGSKRRKKVKTALIYLLITLIAFIMIFPLIWMIFASFEPSNEVFDNSHLLPRVWKFDNFKNGWNGVKPYSYLKFYCNTFLLVGGVIAGNLFSSAVVGYGFARGRFKGKNFLFSLLMGTMMLPGTVTMIPNFIIFNKLGWVNTYLPQSMCVEVPVVIHRNRYEGVCIGEMPKALAALSTVHGAVQDLTVDAAMYGDYHAALQALSLDPMCYTLTLEERESLLQELIDNSAVYMYESFGKGGRE